MVLDALSCIGAHEDRRGQDGGGRKIPGLLIQPCDAVDSRGFGLEDESDHGLQSMAAPGMPILLSLCSEFSPQSSAAICYSSILLPYYSFTFVYSVYVCFSCVTFV